MRGFAIILACGLVSALCVSLLADSFAQTAETELEYSRLTLGGGYSAHGKYEVNDSITQDTGATVQKSGRYEVSSVKSDPGQLLTSVEHWQEYR